MEANPGAKFLLAHDLIFKNYTLAPPLPVMEGHKLNRNIWKQRGNMAFWISLNFNSLPAKEPKQKT